MVKHVPNQRSALDQVFRALADGTRRDMVERLVRGPATVGELAAPTSMSLPAVLQHLRVLEDAGLIHTEKHGRVRTCQIEPAVLRAAEDWIGGQRTTWEHRLDALAELLTEDPHDKGADS